MPHVLEYGSRVACVGSAAVGMAGLSCLIYYSTTFIQPELSKTEGISASEADVIAAAICLSGVAFVAVVGALAGACVGGSPNYFYNAAQACGKCCYDFFSFEENISASETGMHSYHV